MRRHRPFRHTTIHQATGTRPRSRAPRPVVFDCDGLLIDSNGHWDRAYTTLFARYHATLNREDRRRLVGLGLTDLSTALADLLGHPKAAHQLADDILELVTTNIGTGVAPMPGAITLVTALAGTRPLAIASNSPTEVVRDYLRATGIPDVFDTIVGAGDAPPKPAPDLYQLACQRLGHHPRQTIALEDSPTGIRSARDAGTTVYAVPRHPDAHRGFPSLDDPALRVALDATWRPVRASAPRTRS